MNPRLSFLAASALTVCSTLYAATNAVEPENLAYQRKTTVGAYNERGRKNPKWDADAVEAVEMFAGVRASDSLPADTRTKLVGVLKRLTEAKCDDPLVRYLYVRFVFGDTHSAAENAAAYKEVASALKTSSYPDVRKFYAARWAYTISQQANSSDPALPGLFCATGRPRWAGLWLTRLCPKRKRSMRVTC